MKQIFTMVESGIDDDYLLEVEVDEPDEMEVEEKKMLPKSELIRELRF